MPYHLLENRFLQFIRKHHLVQDGDQVLLAFSGGLDSSVLLHLLVRLHVPVHAAHCNFGLRGEESDLDESFCEEQCRALKVPFTSRRFETTTHAQSKKVSIQMAARELRYAWFRELITAHGYNSLATAHHRGDQAETVLLHLADGKSFEALQGIPVRNGHIIRPLLPFGKEDLLTYAVEKKISWRDDSSNVAVEYRRNKIRHQVIPLLKTLNPAIEDTLIRFAQRLQSWNRLAQDEIEKITAGLTEEKNGSFIVHTGSIREHPALDILLWKLLVPYGFSGTQISDILAGLNHTGARFESNAFTLNIDRESLLLTPAKKHDSFPNWILHDADSRLDTAIFTLESSLIERPDGDFSFPTDPNIAWLDAGTVAFPLTIDRWQDGDRFQPLGMANSKKLSDYFIDRKFPQPDKERILIIRSGDRIVWLAGERIDHRFRVRPDTDKILILKFYPR